MANYFVVLGILHYPILIEPFHKIMFKDTILLDSVTNEGCLASSICGYIKGILRDHRSHSALNFHEIQDFCIFVMVLDV